MKMQEFTGVPIVLTVPGDILRQELDARGLSQRAFAEMIGRPEQVVSEIIRGKKRITANTALDFAEALGIEAEFWLNLEVNYELDQARRNPA
jgi:HTH-type transcriptional regulator / antitoxin HigA